MTEPLTDAEIDAMVMSLTDAMCEACVYERAREYWRKRIADLCAQAKQANALRQQKWIAVTPETMPKPGKVVLASLVNPLGNRRTLRAHYSPKHTVDASHWENDEYTETTETGCYEPEGWWEDPVVGETLEFIGASDGKVTHWQALPAPPPAEQPKAADPATASSPNGDASARVAQPLVADTPESAAPVDSTERTDTSAGQVQPSRAER